MTVSAPGQHARRHRGSRLRRVSSEQVTLVVIALLVGTVAVVPLARLSLEGIAPGGTLDMGPLREALTSRSTWRATLHSLETSLVGMAGAVALGTVFAFLVSLTDVRAKLLLVFCFMLPMMIPPQITALSWIQVFGPSSALLNTLGIAPPPGTPNPIYSREGIMVLLAVQHAPLAFLVLRAAFRQLPRELIEAARMTGARPARIAATVILPLLTPALAASAALTFVSALGNFGIPAMLGIPASYYVLPTLIYRRLSTFGPSLISDVAILAVIVGLIGAAVIIGHGILASRVEARLVTKPGAPLFLPLGRWRLAIETTLWALILVILVLPLTALVATALVPAYGVPLSLATMTLDNFVEVLFRQAATVRAFINSGFLAGTAAVVLAILAVPLGYFLVWRRLRLARVLATAAEAPYALPGVVLAIAMILVFIKPLPLLGISLYGTLWIIFIAYLARFLALGLRPVIAGFEQLDPRLEEAARMAGAGFLMRLRTITAPLLGPVAAAGAILVFVTAVNELTVSALLWSAGNETLGVIVFNLDDGGYSVLASAVAVVTVFAVFALMLIAQALSGRLPPGVLPWSDSAAR